jgi:hypothetical protein
MSATPALLRALNERTVLSDPHGAIRASSCRRVRISKPTVSLALQSLARAARWEVGRLRQAPLWRDPIRGRPEARLVLGLDMGARFLRGDLRSAR